MKKQKNRKIQLSDYTETSYEVHYDEILDDPIYRSIFRSSFQKLKEKCRDLIKKVLEELSIKRIAEDLGLSHDTARKRKIRCQKALIGVIQANPDYVSLRKNNEIPAIKPFN